MLTKTEIHQKLQALKTEARMKLDEIAYWEQEMTQAPEHIGRLKYTISFLTREEPCRRSTWEEYTKSCYKSLTEDFCTELEFLARMDDLQPISIKVEAIHDGNRAAES